MRLSLLISHNSGETSASLSGSSGKTESCIGAVFCTPIATASAARGLFLILLMEISISGCVTAAPPSVDSSAFASIQLRSTSAYLNTGKSVLLLVLVHSTGGALPASTVFATLRGRNLLIYQNEPLFLGVGLS